MTEGGEDTERRARIRSAFGLALAAQLDRLDMTQADLADALNRSASYTNQVITGRKLASPGLVDDVADTLSLSAHARRRLHYAAAVDHGFKLDLTERKDPGK